MADQIEMFREHYRRDTIPERYEGMRNLRANLALCALLVAGSLLVLGVPDAVGVVGCLTGLLIFNFFEYAFHRWVSHRRRPGLRRSYQRHTGEHHGFFSADRMTSPELRDYHVTIMPPGTIAASFLVFMLLIGLPLALLAGRQCAAGFALGVALSLFQLDLLHFYYHLSPDAPLCRWLDRLAYFRFLKRLHRTHHDRRHMTQVAFNITHPLFDLILGTLPKKEHTDHGSR